MPAQGIHQHCALAYQPLPTSVQKHSGLLFSRLGWNEPHRRPRNRLADRFGIRSVVLVPFDVGLHVLRTTPRPTATEAAAAKPASMPTGEPTAAVTTAEPTTVTTAPLVFLRMGSLLWNDL